MNSGSTENKCILCKDRVFENLSSFDNKFSIAKCNKCNAVFAYPSPTDGDLKKAYENFPYLTEVFAPKSAKKIANEFDKIIKKYSPESKTVLEIGCSTGYILYGLKHFGYEVVGTDFSSEAARFASEKYGMQVFVSDFPPGDQKFDAIILNHVIEHVTDPREFISKTEKFLKPGGILIVSTPNLNSIGFKIFGYKYPVVSPPYHLSYFDEKNLGSLFSNGFNILETKYTSYVIGRNPFIYNAMVCIKSILNGRPIASMINVAGNQGGEQKNFRKQIRKIIQFVLYPFFFIFDRVGLGENITIVSKRL